MLKVVGASWEQTRLTQFLLIIVILIAIFAIFFYEASPKNMDGRYAATATWNDKTGFKIDFLGQNNDPATVGLNVARAYYRPLQKNTGWATLEIETSENYNDSIQARAAGLLEGSLNWQLIYWHWQNTVGAACMEREEFCTNVKTFLEENYKKVKASAINYEKTNAFWYQVNLFYIQLEGILEGWELGKKRSRSKYGEDLTIVDFLWMNHVNDVRDLELEFNSDTPTYNPTNPPADVAVIKYTAQSDSKFVLGHQTTGLYSEMLRVLKKYTFSYHTPSDRTSNLVPGRQISFTSYPGTIHSQDDFYQINGESSLQIVSSRLRNHNPKSWKNLHDLTVLMGGRAMAANRLATSAQDWSSLITKYNSGTGNKAWLALDHQKPDPSLWLVEQVPGFSNKTDITDNWKEKGFWINCGIPHSQKILEIIGLTSTSSGKQEMAYTESIRQLLEDGIDEVTNTDTLYTLLTQPSLVKKARSDLSADPSGNLEVRNPQSLIENDPLSHSPSKLIPTNKVGIFQKQPVEGKILATAAKIVTEFYDSATTAYNGIIDTKLAYDMTDFKAVTGPLYTDNDAQHAPFQWSKVEPKGNFHIGQPDLWNFQPVQPNFVW